MKAKVVKLHRQGKTAEEISSQEGLAADFCRRWIAHSQVGKVATSRKAQRCPGCGGMVYMPCAACKVRAAIS